MSQTAAAVSRPGAFVPFKLDERSLGVKMTAVFLGTLFLAASSWVQVPMVPVPITMQTFAVTLVGALMGWRLGGITIMAWFAEAAVGFPVLAGGAGGLAHFAGPTGGYLFAFIVAAMAVGWCAERGWTRGNVFSAFAVMLGANALILAIGASWLAMLIGAEAAITAGVTPFIVGAVLKSALAVATIEAGFKLKRAKRG
jgi:biotin transport system substrate-specific component